MIKLSDLFEKYKFVVVPCPCCMGFGGSVDSVCDICKGTGSIQYSLEDCEVGP